MPRRTKPDAYAVDGVDYTDWGSEDGSGSDNGGDGGVGQVQSRAHMLSQWSVARVKAVLWTDTAGHDVLLKRSAAPQAPT